MAALGAAGLQHVHEQRLMVGFSERLSSADDAGASLREVEVITPPAEEDVPAMREHLRHVFTHFILRNVPLLLKGGVSHWPCTTRWTDEYLDANVGHCELRVRKRPLPGGVFGDVTQCERELYTWQSMTIREYIAAMHHQTPPSDPHSSESRAALYAARVPLQADDALHFIGTEVPPPSHLPYAATVGREVPGGAVMYWGEGGQRTPLHYDPYENFMCAIDGEKHIRLFHPSAAAALYPMDGVQYKYSQVPLPYSPELVDKFPRFQEASFVDVTVERGDILYLPAFWWHDVRGGPGRNVTVNYWYALHPMKLDFKAAALVPVAALRPPPAADGEGGGPEGRVRSVEEDDGER